MHARHRGAARARARPPPASLTDLGLAARDQELAARSIVPVAILELPAVRLDDTAEATAYYVLAEAATNAQRYAHASLIAVRADIGPARPAIEIVDDGVGGAHETVGSGLHGPARSGRVRSAAASSSTAAPATGRESPR